jgi:hypothetical protein
MVLASSLHHHLVNPDFMYVPLTIASLFLNCRHVAMDESAAAAELGLDMTADLVTVPMNAGDVLLFNNLIPHR